MERSPTHVPMCSKVNSGNIRLPLRSFASIGVPLDVLDKIDEVISDVISGQGDIPIEPETARQRSHSRLAHAEQHHVICDSSYIPLNQETFNWPSTQQPDGFAPSSSHQSERIVVAELISSILSTGASSAMWFLSALSPSCFGCSVRFYSLPFLSQYNQPPVMNKCEQETFSCGLSFVFVFLSFASSSSLSLVIHLISFLSFAIDKLWTFQLPGTCCYCLIWLKAKKPLRK